MASALRPILRGTSHPTWTSATTPFVCQQCRHARLLRRPKRPYTFTQLVTLSDGSAFTMRTTSPLPVYRSTRDTRNAPLWNPSSKELLNVEEDEAGRLAGFRARFGKGFDAPKEMNPAAESGDTGAPTGVDFKETAAPLDEFGNDFSDDDANLLDLISSYGQEGAGQNQSKKGGKGK